MQFSQRVPPAAGSPGDVAGDVDGDLAAAVDALALVDHHVHGATSRTVTRTELEGMLTESDRPVPGWMTQFDSQLGFAVRRWCAPLLDLPAHADPDGYVARRAELGPDEVNRRLLRASGIGHFLLDTGYRSDDVLDVAGMAGASGRPAHEVVRLEAVAEEVAASGVTATSFADAVAARLWEAASGAVGLKSIVAYRGGFEFDPAPPGAGEVRAAAGRWLARVEAPGTRTGPVTDPATDPATDPVTGRARLTDPVLLRFLLWTGVERGLPLQLHTGYGDPDLDLHRCGPLLLTEWLRRVEPHRIPVMLLHCYPYHRHAGYLAQVFPHVYFDVGLGVNHTGARAVAVVAESLELAPFAKICFSTDAWGPAELHYLGAKLWRRALTAVLSDWVQAGEWAPAEAARIARLIGVDNAVRVYRLPR